MCIYICVRSYVLIFLRSYLGSHILGSYTYIDIVIDTDVCVFTCTCLYRLLVTILAL